MDASSNSSGHLSGDDMDEEIRRLHELLEKKTVIGRHSKVDEEIRRVKKEIEDPKETMLTFELGDMKDNERVTALLKVAQEKSKRREEELRAQMMDRQEGAIKRIGYQLQNTDEAYVCFLIDLTASMSILLPYVKNMIRNICQYLKEMKIHCLYGIVGYRDAEHVRNITYHDFSEEEFMFNFLDIKVKACTEIPNSSGKNPDIPEDVLGGFTTVRHLAWPKPKRSRGIGKAIIHFADAPCHGSKYHILHDNKPEGDDNASIEQEMIYLAQSNFNYSFFSASHANDKMIEVMKQAFGTVHNESADFHVNEAMLALSLII